MTSNGCGIRHEIVLRSLSIVHLVLVVSNFFVLDPRVFAPLYIIYSIGVVCFFTLFIYSCVKYQAWFFVVALCFQALYIISAGYLASLALMGYFTIKMTLMCVVFGTNTLVIITDAISMIAVLTIRSDQLRRRAERKRYERRRSNFEASFPKY
ncbi:hypothetical protein GCK72_011935 [Caenorhabditis remanei]|uniref:Uncharacterized protein n=1 Tax=Caenorhabditis remanei TaxID=31234 RepID=A0A6A5H7G0_CAERE|nr:hypothetical protein GCK72_011935 [Caenorhabditis remanei]KAF1763668.1 hypothetical protein GCK72_011935 [Caenorhabditis remanei]